MSAIYSFLHIQQYMHAFNLYMHEENCRKNRGLVEIFPIKEEFPAKLLLAKEGVQRVG